VNVYICFYRGERLEVHADTTLEAQQKAQAIMQKKYPRRKVKGYEINTNLAELGGEQVTHIAVD
jgi:hypothetical protein